MAEDRQCIEYGLELIADKRWSELAASLRKQHPADIAELIEAVDEEDRPRVFAITLPTAKPDVLAELEDRIGSDVLEHLTSMEISDIVEEMSPDDAADVLHYLSEERSQEVLRLMEDEESEEVRELLRYGEETAGGIMTPDFVSMPANLSVSEAIERIAYVDQDEPFYYTYVVDENGRCIGYIGLWELLKLRERGRKLDDLTHRDFVCASVETDQEECAHLMAKYDLSSLPVLDHEGKLVGRITVDDVMDVMEEEASEDIFRLAGSKDDELTYDSPLQASAARLPWLLITLVTGFVSSLLLRQFMTNLSSAIVLAFFVPIVMAMGGNTGIQSSTLMIRGLALGTLQGRKLGPLLTKEIASGAMMGVVCGLLIGGWARLVILWSPDAGILYPPWFLAVVVAVALFSAMTFAALFGALVPFLLHRFKIDPAVASGPFVTASNDICALLIYYFVTIGMIAVVRHFV